MVCKGPKYHRTNRKGFCRRSFGGNMLSRCIVGDPDLNCKGLLPWISWTKYSMVKGNLKKAGKARRMRFNFSFTNIITYTYLEYLIGRRLKMASIRNYVTGIRHVQLLRDHYINMVAVTTASLRKLKKNLDSRLLGSFKELQDP